jgi:cell division protein FtsL
MIVTKEKNQNNRNDGLRRKIPNSVSNVWNSEVFCNKCSFGSYLFAVALVAASLTFYVYFRVGSLRVGYQLTQARQDQLQLVMENRALKTEIGMLSAPSRIRAIATQQLQMTPADRIVDLYEVKR